MIEVMTIKNGRSIDIYLMIMYTVERDIIILRAFMDCA